MRCADNVGTRPLLAYTVGRGRTRATPFPTTSTPAPGAHDLLDEDGTLLDEEPLLCPYLARLVRSQAPCCPSNQPQ